MPIQWSSVTVETRDEYEDEPLGTKPKFWVQNPDDDTIWLFKFARSDGTHTRGEDWAEWVVHHLGELLGTPTAQVLAATCAGRRGIVSRRVMDPSIGERLVHGNSLLIEMDPSYDSTLRRENPRYTVDAVRLALADAAAPEGFDGPGEMDAFDVWAGYLMLDAWVAGRDRHHENWAVVSSGRGRVLAASFDHGNALGFQERDEHLIVLNGDGDVRARWLARGRSHHFAGRPALVELAHEALSKASAAARVHWERRLRSISMDEASAIVYAVPQEIMSDPSHTFAVHVLNENRERLLRDYPDR